MKHICLRVIEQPRLSDGREAPKFRYREVLEQIITQQSVIWSQSQGEYVGKGIDIAEQLRRLRLLNGLTPFKDGEIWHVEDSDWEVLVELVDLWRWVIASQMAVDFNRAVHDGADSLEQIGVAPPMADHDADVPEPNHVDDILAPIEG